VVRRHPRGRCGLLPSRATFFRSIVEDGCAPQAAPPSPRTTRST